ncbi:hypothetical protein TNIN_373161 [Trichonephila inaurata madagascariensis]|uniref:Uncharacterized protein n=1 Tax=Trichonephila inaurata madagascariensis TaxID=2747483 RepID=A0A8X7CL90_9ARAC|nr:hypothetical protein TNIN_373161 [Trichonephila inaurata madagascariensis]
MSIDPIPAANQVPTFNYHQRLFLMNMLTKAMMSDVDPNKALLLSRYCQSKFWNVQLVLSLTVSNAMERDLNLLAQVEPNQDQYFVPPEFNGPSEKRALEEDDAEETVVDCIPSKHQKMEYSCV